MQDVELKLRELLKKKGWNAETAARQLGVSRASFYKYLAKEDVPSFDVLKRAHDLWGLQFDFIDFGYSRPRPVPSEKEAPRQYILPFIQAVNERDVEIVRAKPVKPDILELTVRIRFVG